MPDRNAQTRIIYLHGFNSSPDSEKAQIFSRYFSNSSNANDSGIDLHIPALPFDPELAVILLEKLINEVDTCHLVGSSLGGYYATYLAEKYCLKAALINPAVSSEENLGANFLGRHTNYYTNEEYELTTKHVDFFTTLDRDVLQYPQNYLLLVQTGDKVCDYRLAVERYADAKQIVQPGGDHSFIDFEAVLPDIFRFFKLEN